MKHPITRFCRFLRNTLHSNVTYYTFLAFFALCAAISARAQELVIYNARDLFPKEAWNPPCKAVFTQEYCDSEEWKALEDRITKYLLYQSAQEDPDWIPLADEEFRQMIEEGKSIKPEALQKAKFYASDVEGYWGKRGGKYYMVDILTGRELGSFTFSRRDKENIFFDVEVTWF